MTARPDDELVRHARSLRGLARALVGVQDADDVVQDAAVEVLRRPPRDGVSVFGWLAGVVRNRARRHHRATRRRATRERRAASTPDAVTTAPLDAAVHRETVARLDAALLGLPQPYQDTLLWRYYEGLGPLEIAARTGGIDQIGGVHRGNRQRHAALEESRCRRCRATWCDDSAGELGPARDLDRVAILRRRHSRGEIRMLRRDLQHRLGREPRRAAQSDADQDHIRSHGAQHGSGNGSTAPGTGHARLREHDQEPQTGARVRSKSISGAQTSVGVHGSARATVSAVV